MSPIRNRCALRLASAGWCAVALWAAPVQARTIAPFRVALVVHWGAGAGSDVFRDDLARTVAAEFATRCFASVVMADPGGVAEDADLVFDVLLSDVFDETRFDDSIATTLEPGEPTKELRRVAYFSVAVDAELSARASGRAVTRKKFIIHEERRPVFIGEDPQATARLQAIRSVLGSLAKGIGCGSAKLERKAREALQESDPASPGAR